MLLMRVEEREMHQDFDLANETHLCPVSAVTGALGPINGVKAMASNR